MNHVLKLDERAFNKGVRDVLHLKPLVRVVKASVERHTETAPTDNKKVEIVGRKPR